MEYWGLLKALERGEVPTLLLLHGRESLLIDELLDRLTRACFPDPAQAALDRESLVGEATTADAILGAAASLPFLAARRLVIVREAGALPAREAERFLAEMERLRGAAGAWPPPSAAVVFAAQALDARAPLRKAVPPEAQVEVRAPTGRALVGWLQARARGLGVELTDEAAELLIDLVGEEPGRLAGELEKAWLYAGERRIDVAEVRTVVGETRVRRLFELTRALEGGEAGAALRTLDALLTGGEEPLGLLAQVTRHVRELWQAKGWAEQGRAVPELARQLRRPPKAVEALLARAGAIPEARLGRALAECWEVERRLKSSRDDPAGLLAVLVAGLCRG